MSEDNKPSSPPRQLPPPQHQQIIVERGYTFGQFCLHFCAFIFVFFMISLLGCSMLVGGCNNALKDMTADERMRLKDSAEAEKQEGLPKATREEINELRAIVERERELLKSIQ